MEFNTTQEGKMSPATEIKTEQASPHQKNASMCKSMSNQQRKSKGGLITMPFIIANEAFEKVASYGLLSNMILYLMRDYRIGVAKGANVIFYWSAVTNFTPIIGAFVADSFLGRYFTIGLGSIASVSGMTLLWLTAMIPKLKPSTCNITSGNCESATAGQMAFLASSFALISIGAGGIRPCTLAFGADQVDRRGDPRNERVLESFFGWYYASASVSVLIALTAIVYIQEHLGWRVGFGVPAILMFFATLLFFLASQLYIKQKPNKSLFTGFVQVPVAAYKNRKLVLPPEDSADAQYHNNKEAEYVVPTRKLRFLNRACIIKNRDKDIAPDGSASNPWSLCTVEKVEELKALIKVLPIWSTGIMMAINVNQSSFQLLQANSMNRKIGSSFQVPAASYSMFVIITLTIYIIFYDRVIIPVASKIMGRPVYLGVKTRMGIGLFFSCTAMVVSALVEGARRKRAIQEGLQDNPQGVVEMSATWLVPQYCLHGLAEAFNAIGQTEFYYSEFPKSMSSIASALFGLGMAVGNLLAALVVSMVDDITSKGGKQSWISDNINNSHYDKYYWLLAILSFINLLYYFVCSWAYGPCVGRITQNPGNGIHLTPEEELCKLEASPRDGRGEELHLASTCKK